MIVTANISDDNKLLNIATSTANKVNSGELVANPNISLENTIWNGSIGNPAQTMQLGFLPNSKVNLKVGTSIVNSNIYTRPASGGFIRFSVSANEFLGVVTSANLISGAGSYSNSNYS